MSIDDFLNSHGYSNISEGYSQQVPGQIKDLITLTKSSNINVMEIGFNAGHSADVFLKNNSSLSLTSFDLGYHNYVAVGKKYIDETYPNRHILILGNSTVTIPQYIANNKGKTFDIIFIDGGHEYETANSDIMNCMKLAHKDTIVIIDDTNYTPGWVAPFNIGPTAAWVDNVANNNIIEINKKDYRMHRGMSWGKYNLH